MKNNKIITTLSNFVLIIIVAFVAVVGITLNNSAVLEVTATLENGVIYAGQQGSNKVSLMINVYWGTEHLEEMLTELEKYNAKCTFFVGGSWAIENEDILKLIKNKGHEIGNHGYFHKDHAKLNHTQNKDEISKTHNIVKSILNIDMNLFAPPSGSYSKTTVSVAEELGYKTIMWTRDTVDWRDKDATIIYNRAVEKIKGGDLILMHPTGPTKQALPSILKFIYENNLVATTVTDAIN